MTGWLLIAVIALQVSAFVAIAGILVTTGISLYGTLSLIRSTLRDISRISSTLDAVVEVLRRRNSI